MKINWIAKLLPIALLTIGITSLAHAQVAGPTGGQIAPQAKVAKKAGHPIKAALATLTLTPEQKKKIKSLEKARAQDLKQYKAANPGAGIVDRSGLKAHSAAAKQTLLNGIKAVLTPAQWDQFQSKLASFKKKGKKRNKVAPTPPPANN